VISGAADRRVRVFDTRMPKRANCVSTWQVRVAGRSGRCCIMYSNHCLFPCHSIWNALLLEKISTQTCFIIPSCCRDIRRGS
jgi:hypothetical protein